MKIQALGVILLVVVTRSNGQIGGLDIWELGLMPYGIGECAKLGSNIPGLGLPVFDDPWFILIGTCKTFQGSVGCDGKVEGTCKCNQLDDQEFDGENCLGLVGAYCTAEYTSFIPQKNCTLNAHCVPEQGDGHTVGRCECLHGYMENNATRKCEDDPAIPEKGTPRPITTTEAPDKGEFQLPIDLLLNARFGTLYEQDCQSGALLNRTYCDTYGLTVSCLAKKCRCNMEDDSIFDETLNACVGRSGSYCLARRSLLGWKLCTEGADCFMEGGKDVKDYSLGTCQCMYGYKTEADGRCTRDESISNPSTRRSVGMPTPTTTAPETTTPPAREGAAAMESQKFVVLFMTLFCILSVIYSR